MKVLGRVLLFVAAGFLIVFSFITFFVAIKDLIAVNWSFATEAEKAIWTTFISTGVQVLVGIYLIFRTFVPKRSFAMIVASILLFAPPVVMLVMDIRAGTLTGFDWGVFQKYGPSFIAPVLYLLGTIFYFVGSANE